MVPYKKENIQDYSKRLIAQIDLSKEIIIVGVSFGGIVAQEIAKLVNVKKIILISSIKSIKELDWKLQVVKNLKFNTVIPSRFLKWSNLLTADYNFGVQSKTESDLLKQIVIDTDRRFMKWAISEIMHWNNFDELSEKIGL